MIIRMTVNDNDFTHVIESFASNLMKVLRFGSDNELQELENSQDQAKINEFYKRYRRVSNLLNPNTNSNLDVESRKFLCDEINHLWSRYVKRYIDNFHDDSESNSVEYLIQNFKVNLWYRMFDKCENGEAVYLFTVQNVVIVQ